MKEGDTVICIDASHNSYLTKGKTYKIQYLTSDRIAVHCDDGILRLRWFERFKLVNHCICGTKVNKIHLYWCKVNE